MAHNCNLTIPFAFLHKLGDKHECGCGRNFVVVDDSLIKGALLWRDVTQPISHEIILTEASNV
jgi:hypothetical protein